jgi:molybdenum cofactor cytidylyltransferase
MAVADRDVVERTPPMSEPSTDNVPRIAAILLAAGASRRMGGANKLLLPVADEPMIRRVARMLLASLAVSVTVVTGHEAARIAGALDGLAVRLVHNEHHADGQMTSVRAGLLASEAADGYLVCLGDQPALSVAEIDHLIGAFATAPPGRILVPLWQGRRGNPIILPASARAEVEAGGVNFGCRNLISRHPERVTMVEAQSAAVLADIDTPSAYAALVATGAIA